MRYLAFVWVLAFSDFAAAEGNRTILSFSTAKDRAEAIHADHPFTVYCGCKYKSVDGSLAVDLASCGYKVHKNEKRARRLEWEHIVPAESFGQSFDEWRNEGDKFSACVDSGGKPYKGRRCAQKNELFKRMEADLYNIFPSEGELNGLRSNRSVEALGGPKANRGVTKKGKPLAITFGGCEAVITKNKFEPPDRAKGIVARTYLYMDQAYPKANIISRSNRKLIEAWDRMFPVTEVECVRADKIKAIQGNENPVLAASCALLRKNRRGRAPPADLETGIVPAAHKTSSGN